MLSTERAEQGTAGLQAPLLLLQLWSPMLHKGRQLGNRSSTTMPLERADHIQVLQTGRTRRDAHPEAGEAPGAPILPGKPGPRSCLQPTYWAQLRWLPTAKHQLPHRQLTHVSSQGAGRLLLATWFRTGWILRFYGCFTSL